MRLLSQTNNFLNRLQYHLYEERFLAFFVVLQPGPSKVAIRLSQSLNYIVQFQILKHVQGFKLNSDLLQGKSPALVRGRNLDVPPYVEIVLSSRELFDRVVCVGD